MPNKQQIIVTGGSGFIGGHLITALSDRGYSGFNLDNKKPSTQSDWNWVQGDLLDAKFLCELVNNLQPEVIINLGAHASLAGGPQAMSVNYEGVANLINAIRVRSPRTFLIQASTQLVAGPSTASFDPKRLSPFGTYGESKATAERILFSADDIHWMIVRPTNIWGPNHPSFARNIWRYIELGLYLHPDGKDPLRSYGYVENVANQIIDLMINRAKTIHNVFYVGDMPVPSADWLDAFGRALTGKPVRRVPSRLLNALAHVGEISGQFGGPAPMNLGRYSRMTTDFPVAMAPTFQITGAPRIELEDGVQRTVDWLRSRR